MHLLGRIWWILDIIWPLNQDFKLKNQRNWLKQVWMLKLWSEINCFFMHWTKKLTLAQNPSFMRLNIPPFLKNDMHTVMWVKVPDHESNLSCCLACMTLVECQHTVTSFTSISRLRDFYDNLVYVTHSMRKISRIFTMYYTR